MLSGKKDITDEEFETILLPFFTNYNEYIVKFLVPDAIAFYLANGYFRNCLSVCPLQNHINSAADIFNIRYEKEDIMPMIKDILRIKYNLLIEKTNPLVMKKVI